jgi:hypothetical protein
MSNDALEQLRRRAAGCRDCDLWRAATQTVFGCRHWLDAEIELARLGLG